MPYKDKSQKAEYNRLYRIKNRENLKNKRKDWELKNKDKLKEYHREYHKVWYERNKVERRKQIKGYSSNHLEDNNRRSQKYRKRHPDKILKYGKIYNITISGKYRSYVFSAKRRQLCWELDVERFVKIINKPCCYCGSLEGLNGIDRVDNSVGYTLQNSKPCCKMCNMMKKNWRKDEFFEHVKQICKYQNLLKN